MGDHESDKHDEEDLLVGQDLTVEYRELVEQARQEDFSALPENAKDFVFLLIPGLFTQHYGKGYMKDIIEQFQALGLDVRKMELNTDLPVVQNAKFIHREIKTLTKEGKQIVALGHSKGGVDFATAVGKFRLYKKIHAFVAIQTPWGGTPFAEQADGGGIIETLHNIVNRLFKADKDAVLDLRYEERQKTMKKYPFDQRRIPTICLSSVLGDGKSMMSPMAGFLKKKYGLESDGAVCPLDSHFEYADYVKLTGLDHGATVFKSGRKNTERDEGKAPEDGSDDDPGDIAYALMVLALRKAEAFERNDPEEEKSAATDEEDDEKDDDEKKEKHKDKDKDSEHKKSKKSKKSKKKSKDSGDEEDEDEDDDGEDEDEDEKSEKEESEEEKSEEKSGSGDDKSE